MSANFHPRFHPETRIIVDTAHSGGAGIDVSHFGLIGGSASYHNINTFWARTRQFLTRSPASRHCYCASPGESRVRRCPVGATDDRSRAGRTWQDHGTGAVGDCTRKRIRAGGVGHARRRGNGPVLILEVCSRRVGRQRRRAARFIPGGARAVGGDRQHPSTTAAARFPIASRRSRSRHR